MWGDARKQLSLIPNALNFDLILHDPFSPQKCPQLWSEEFLKSLTSRLSPNGRFITYSSSAAMRGSLRRAGLRIYSTIPIDNKSKKWSIGTIAILPGINSIEIEKFSNWRPLNQMEEEHLLTNASIPFRDPSSNGTSQEILNRRSEEQRKSNLPSTSSWRKRWKIKQSG